MCVSQTQPSTSKRRSAGNSPTRGGIVDVAVHSAQGLPTGQFVGHPQTADVARMPYLVAASEVLLQRRVQPAVGVAQQSDAKHGAKVVPTFPLSAFSVQPSAFRVQPSAFNLQPSPRAPLRPPMPRSFLEIAFDGTAYAGWQVQPHSPSMQAEVERALAVALGRSGWR